MTWLLASLCLLAAIFFFRRMTRRPPLPARDLRDGMFSNNEFFAFLRQEPSDHPFMQRSIALTVPKFEACRAPGLSLVVEPDPDDAKRYLITITNAGRLTYENLRVRYERLLLDAESFGIDTTHMPSGLARKPGEAIEIHVLAPKQSIRLVRPGYGTHDEYHGPHESAVDLDFRLEGKTFTAEDRRWTQVTVQLPNSSKDGASES